MPGSRQLSLVDFPVTRAELTRDRGSDYGEVFTRRWVVELILDFVGYTRTSTSAVGVWSSLLRDRRLPGPGCRPSHRACRRYARHLGSIGGAIRAFDLLEANAERARKAAAHRLEQAGLDRASAEEIAATWVTTGDFLLAGHEPGSAHHVVGNPPYIRLENVPAAADGRLPAALYDHAWPERHLRWLHRARPRPACTGGHARLHLRGPVDAQPIRGRSPRARRRLVAVDTVLTMHDVDAFEDDVSAYPAIVVLRNGPQGRAVVADAAAAFGEPRPPSSLAGSAVPAPALTLPSVDASRLDRWFDGRDLWPTAARPSSPSWWISRRVPAARRSPHRHAVGIGVATGCDDVYITNNADLVESDRLMPLLQAGDIATGDPAWSGGFLVNPWNEDGLVDLDRYPRLALNSGSTLIGSAAGIWLARAPRQWYRTIDRVHADLQARPKLVLPDIKAAAHPVLDDGRFDPHHNLYFVVSDNWDLEVLRGLLLSDVANLFVGAYCVKMRGGCSGSRPSISVASGSRTSSRFLSLRDRCSLASAFMARDVDKATATALRLYGLDGNLPLKSG